MEHLFEIAPFTGYVYPNETVIPWSALIVAYPYMTGLVAGAFTVSSFHHVFGMSQFKPIARFSLMTALCFMIFVPATLLFHLGHPERALNAMITPHWTSAFVAFSFFAMFYVFLLILEIWFIFRPDLVARANDSKGLLKHLYRALTLWSDDVSKKALEIDRKIIFWLAAIGIPAALGLHGYVGFVFGSLKSREWWGSDMMPVIFIFSAVISGIALLIVLYVVVSRIRGVPVEENCLRGLSMALWGFLMFGILLEGVEFGSLAYKAKEGIDVILDYIGNRLFYRFFVFQFGVGSVVPIILLSYLIIRKTAGKALVIGSFISASLVLMGVFLMRWNVVIGGQEISKSLRGLLEYTPTILGHDGLLLVSAIMVAPLVALWILASALSPWNDGPSEPIHH